MKKRFDFLTVVLALCAFSVASAVNAEDTITEILERGKLLVGLEEGYIPFEMRNKQGEIVGFDVDMMKTAAKAMGVEVEFVNTKWEGIIPALLAKKFDIIASGMTITQERNLKVNFSDPYMTVGQTVLVRESLAGQIKSYKDLDRSKYRVASKLGATGQQAIKRLISRARYVGFESEQEAVSEVISGRIDALIYDFPFNAIMATTRGKNRVVHLDKPFTFEPLGWAIRRGDADFLNWLNHFLRQVKNDGTYDRLHHKWFKNKKWRADIEALD